MSDLMRLVFLMPVHVFLLLLSVSSAVLANSPGYGFFEDESGQLTVQDVYRQRNNFERGSDLLSFGLTSSHIWFYLSADDFPVDDHLWFEVDNAGIDNFNLYRISDGAVSVVNQTGDSMAFSTRMMEFRSFIFELDVSGSDEYLLEIFGKSPLLLPVTYGSRESMFERLSLRENIIMLVYGVIVAMAVMNLLLFVSTHHVPFGWYGFYMLGIIVTLSFTGGTGNAYLWRDQFWFQNHFAYVVVVLTIWSAFNFTRTFLATRQNLPRVDRYFRWLVHSPLITLLVIPSGLFEALEMISFFLALLVLTVIVLGAVSVARRSEGALLFLLGWSVLVIGLISFDFTVLGIVPATEIGRYSAMISVCLEAMILSFAVMYRVRRMERQAKEQIVHAHEEVHQALVQVKNSIEAKDAFVTSVSHRLKTPIHIVMGNLQLIAEELKDSKQRNLVEQTDLYATELLYTIDNLLTYSQVVASDLRILRQRLNIRSEFMRIEDKWKHLYNNKEIKLELCFDPDIPTHLEMEWIHIRKVIRIILEHSVHSMEQGRLLIDLKMISVQGNDWLQCQIRDNSSSVSDQVCQWFNDISADERWEGSSLGLFLCRQLINYVGGRATLSNAADGCVLFDVSWPVVCLPDEHSLTQVSISGQVILVVDDMGVNLKLMKTMLQKLKAEPVLASSGMEAIEIMDHQKIDLILMDCQMPGLSGQETARMLRNEKNIPVQLPIIAVSANDSDVDRESCFEAGMNDFIAKPVRMLALEQKLKFWLVNGENQSDCSLNP